MITITPFHSIERATGIRRSMEPFNGVCTAKQDGVAVNFFILSGERPTAFFNNLAEAVAKSIGDLKVVLMVDVFISEDSIYAIRSYHPAIQFVNGASEAQNMVVLQQYCQWLKEPYTKTSEETIKTIINDCVKKVRFIKLF